MKSSTINLIGWYGLSMGLTTLILCLFLLPKQGPIVEINGKPGIERPAKEFSF